MSKTLSYIFMFSLGAAVGSAVAWRMLKTKYEQIAQEEIDSVKEVFQKRQSELEKAHKSVEAEETVSEEIKEAYEEIARDYNTISTERAKERKEESVKKKPYVISPDEFGMLDEYDDITLTYYADGVLIDDGGEVIKNIDEVVGKESLKHFGDYAGDEDSVYVRNDAKKTDYEILRDYDRYADIYGR